MHLALHLDEVLREIVGWLASPAAQLALALACQSLCNMVLQVLWMHGDAWALAMTMPEQYRRVMSGSQGKLVRFSAARRTLDSDWMGPRFALYARSILTLKLDNYAEAFKADSEEPDKDGFELVHPAIIGAWAFYKKGTPTFPNLRTFAFGWVSNHAAAIRALSHSSLRKLEVHFDRVPVPGSPEYEYVMTYLPASCPALHNLDISISSLDDVQSATVPPLFLPPFSSLPQLRTIGLDTPISPALLRLLASLPHLTALHMPVPSSPPPPLTGFPSLQTLHLGSCALPAAAALLALVSSPALAEISVSTPASSSRRTAAHYLPFTRALTRFTRLECISAHRTGGRELDEARVDECTPLRELLAPLLALRFLRTLNLNLGQCWAGDTGLLEVIASAWPALEVLVLSMPTRRFAVSLEAFATLVHALNLNIGQTWKGDQTLLNEVACTWPGLELFSLSMPAPHFQVSLAAFTEILRTLPQLESSGMAVNSCTPMPRDLPPNLALECFMLAPKDPPRDAYDVVPLGSFLRTVCPNARCVEDRSWGRKRSTRATTPQTISALNAYVRFREASVTAIRLDDKDGE